MAKNKDSEFQKKETLNMQGNFKIMKDKIILIFIEIKNYLYKDSI